MNSLAPLHKYRQQQRGATIVVVALLMTVFIGFAALGVDIGYLKVAENELQNVADAAALAAARQLGHEYELLSYQEQTGYVCNSATITGVADAVARQNKAAGVNIGINEADVSIGQWHADTKTLIPTLDHPDAVRVIARRDDQGNSPIAMFFLRVFAWIFKPEVPKNYESIGRSAIATAALTAESTIDDGLLIPVGISEQWFLNKEEFCDQPIRFYPTNTPEGCAGWNTYEHWPASESYLRKTILEGWVAETFTAPAAGTGDEFVFTGGTLGNQTFTAFQNLYNYMKDAKGEWMTSVAVYKSDSCSNPSGRLEIVGFATAVITQVLPPPDQTIVARVICDRLVTGRGSGGNYGTRGTIPGLVQ